MVIVNRTGSTTGMEMLICYRKAHAKLEEMAGCQLFFAKMDDELLKYWNAPCDTPYLRVSK